MRRSRGIIVLKILELLAQEDRTKTDLVYIGNLNFRTVDQLLEKFVEAAWVAWNERTKRWYITLAGKDAVDHLRAVEVIL